MSSWLDRWAKRLVSPASDARPPVPAEPPAPSAPTSDSRRAFLKKAAVVGGVAWSVPVLQSALAPAASASAGATVGSACSPAGSVCGDGSVCFNGICGYPGATCGSSSQCFGTSCGTDGICGGAGVNCTTLGSDPVCATLLGYTCKQPGGPNSRKCRL